MLLKTAANGFSKTTSQGRGSRSIGARIRFATKRPRISPIDLLTRRSVGIVRIFRINLVRSCWNNNPVSRPRKPPSPARMYLGFSNCSICFHIFSDTRPTPSQLVKAPEIKNRTRISGFTIRSIFGDSRFIYQGCLPQALLERVDVQRRSVYT